MDEAERELVQTWLLNASDDLGLARLAARMIGGREMQFKIGQPYRRDQIQTEYGGSIQSYLPHKDGRVVCGCFDLKMNPNAPGEILVGDAPDVIRSAELLIRQDEPIPVFIKEAKNRWIYQGHYRGAGWPRDGGKLG